MDIQFWTALELQEADKPVLWKPNLQVKCSHPAHATELDLVHGQSVKNSAVKGEYTTWCKNDRASSLISSSLH